MPKILTIDDEPEFTGLITNYFGPRGFEVLTADAGDKGLMMVRRERPDVCLIDLKMPGLHGDEVLREVKAFDSRIQCIMITASEGEGKTRAHLMEMGAYSCFDKPLTSLKDLEADIRQALKANANFQPKS